MAEDETANVDERDADDAGVTDDSHDEPKELGDKGREALKRERDAREAEKKRANDAEKRLAALEKTLKERDDAVAKEKGDWEKIAKDTEIELEKLRDDIAQRDLNARKAAIAKTHGIPDEFVDRLKGETDEDIEADAKDVAKYLKRRESPDNDAGEKTPPGVKKSDKSKYADPTLWGIRR